MSVLTVTLDTDVGTLSATIDGQTIDGITSLMIYKDDYAKSGYYADFSVEKEKVGDATKYTHYCLSSEVYAKEKKMKPTKTKNVYVKSECEK